MGYSFATEKAVKTVELDYPIRDDVTGEVIDKVTLRRMTARQVREFVEKAMAGEFAELPIADIPSEALEALDGDDRERIEQAVLDFMPVRLRAAHAAGEQKLRETQEEPSSENAPPSSPSSPQS